MKQDQIGPYWAELQALETHLLRQLTVEQGVQQCLTLVTEFQRLCGSQEEGESLTTTEFRRLTA